MKFKELKLEVVVKDVISVSHEKTRNMLEANFLGKYDLQRIESKRI